MERNLGVAAGFAEIERPIFALRILADRMDGLDRLTRPLERAHGIVGHLVRQVRATEHQVSAIVQRGHVLVHAREAAGFDGQGAHPEALL